MSEPSTTSRLREAPAAEAAARVAPRRKTAEQRLRIQQRLTMGLTVAHIARVEQLTAPRARQIIAEMLASREVDPARRLRSIAGRPAERSDDRRAHDDDAGRFPGDGSMDRVDERTRPLSPLLAGPNSLGEGWGGATPPRRARAPCAISPGRGVSFAGIAAREGPDGKNGIARKWRRNGLKRLNPRPEMVWARKPRTHKMWYTGAADSGATPADEAVRMTKLQFRKGNFPPRNPLKSLKTEKESRKRRRRGFPSPSLGGGVGGGALRGSTGMTAEERR
jgi:hypothetical protein